MTTLSPNLPYSKISLALVKNLDGYKSKIKTMRSCSTLYTWNMLWSGKWT